MPKRNRQLTAQFIDLACLSRLYRKKKLTTTSKEKIKLTKANDE